FEILSIDIADVDVGENVGAKLDIDRANAKKQVAQADAEKRAAEARATQAEQEARIAEMRAEVVKAEAQIPLAMAEAFREGNLGIMDYYRMRNIQADTDMRNSIGGEEE
ncbi:MAG: flotillin-like FloA family protein, partial [Planctomycetes bacterium]|nr:flotillin-like FloA family protein [Planctomycetota bacterium]